ncbi:MAG TPA: DUF2339 domain-containing protein [Gallionella sp.]|nr:DUF2339 domain-containing protein [Gallionella sp.]
MWLIGLVVGAWVGSNFGFGGTLLGSAVGSLIGILLAQLKKSEQEFSLQLKRMNEVIMRLSKRLDVLEKLQPGDVAGSKVVTPEQQLKSQTLPPIVMAESFPPVSSSQPLSQAAPEQKARPTQTDTARQKQPVQSSAQPASDFALLTSSPLWQKLFGGNILAKVGVVILFFGVASGLKLAADYGMFPVSVRLLLASVASVAMIMFGWSRATGEKHRMFGLALQGGGFAVLYLIVYFMLARYQMVDPQLAFVMFTLLGVSCLLIAAKLDAVTLAVLGTSGAFLSPVLADNHTGNHIALFSYFALLNTLIISVNWFKSWRELNVVGFLFTFAIGIAWAFHSYRSEYMLSTEFFLVLFFLMYSLVPVLLLLFKPAGKPGWGDGMLLFGTPLAGIFCQQTLMQSYPYGLAWSAFTVGLYYLLLWWLLYRRSDEATRLMERGHLAIAVAMFTYAIPLAFGAQVTSAFWTMEGCAVLWLGIRQDRYLARLTGIALQVLAGFYFMMHFYELSRSTPVFNDVYVGCFIIGMAGMASGLMLHLWDKKNINTQTVANLLLYWGMFWWMGVSAAEIDKFVSYAYQHASWLGLSIVAAVVFEVAGKSWIWTAMRATALLHFAVIILVAMASLMRHEHVLYGALTLVFPAAVTVHYWILARHEQPPLALLLTQRHLLMLWLLVGLSANELAWVADTLAPGNSLWHILAWGVTLAAAIHIVRVARRFDLWPAPGAAADYHLTGCVPIIIACAGWLVIACTQYSGEGTDLPYIPLLNPFDLVALFVLHACWKWTNSELETQPSNSLRESIRLGCYLGAFFWLSTLAARIAHYWGDVPFEHELLMHSYLMHAILSLIWTVTSISLMIYATQHSQRRVWFVGFGLLAIVGVKLMMIDLANKGTVMWTASLIGIALLVIAASYFSPAPPKHELKAVEE